MAAAAVEARSLSSLTTLASNPPSYPRNPTHVKHDPLVLYIARVPGSRDVFLSPMKPREKVVTAEDIQSSLYFVHIEQPEDARLMQATLSFREPEYDEQPPLPPLPQNRPQAAAVQRKAVPGPPATSTTSNVTKRKPVPGTLAPANNFQNRQNINAASYSQAPTNLLAPDYVPSRSFDSLQHQAEDDRPALPPRKPSEQPYPSSTLLTLIRRDPASGAQWNVARIEDPSVLDISSSALSESPSKRKVGAPIYIDITNPGYSKFIHTEQKSAPTAPTYDADLQEAREDNTLEGRGVFRRRLWMEGSKFPNGDFGHRRLNSYDSGASTRSPRHSTDWQGERPSVDARSQSQAAPPFLSRENQSYSTIQVSEKQTSFRGYAFISPWNGRCEFVTGTAGGSLKCRHLVPGLQGAPPVAMPVSELRFNLPTSSKVTTPRGEESLKRSSFFHKSRHSRNHASFSDSRPSSTEDVRSSFERMDLSLGQEFAGGGFGGKQAKLGKLIIEDEGLKMVDLLVAANIALWWRAYEKRDTRPRSDRGSF